VIETLTSIARAGADLIITYHARDVAQWLGESGTALPTWARSATIAGGQ